MKVKILITTIFVLLLGSLLRADDFWPTTHPADAQKIFIENKNANLYIWREKGDVWLEFELLADSAWICSYSFSAIQDNTQYDCIKLIHKQKQDETFCNDIYINTIFKLGLLTYKADCYWTNGEHFCKPDYNKSFLLIYDSSKIYKIQVGDNSTESSSPNNNEGITKNYIDNLYSYNQGQWMLLGTSSEISDMSIFNSATTVWAWQEGKWLIYSPSYSIKNLLLKFRTLLIGITI
jgi:hypothetical protein